MLEQARGLSVEALDAVADLARRSVAADGGRLKLEFGVLRTRSGRFVEDLLWWDGDRLLGFLGCYAFGPPDVELAGMVDPDARRGGIGAALLDAALPLCRDRGYSQALLVVPRPSTAGREFAIGRGATPHHCEHAMVLPGAPVDGPSDERISLRPAGPGDAAVVSRLLTAGFGDAPSDLAAILESDDHTLIVELSGSAVGTLRLARDGEVGSVYGFVVDPEWQGRGIGRDVLRRVCRQLRADGAVRVGLEVAVENEHALRLYTSIGFEQITTEDYYALPLSSVT